MEPQQYYVTRPDKTQEGPYDINSLITRYQAGKYPTNSLVWREGMSGWENIQQWIQEKTASAQPDTMPPLPQGMPPLNENKLYGSYYAHTAEGKKGPLSQTELQRLFNSGVLQEDTPVWKEGTSDWVPLRDVISTRGFVQGLADILSDWTGTEKISNFSAKRFFGGIFKKHKEQEIVDFFCAGSSTTTPPLNQIVATWPSPWIFARVMLLSVLLFFGFSFVLNIYPDNSANVIPSVMFTGNFAIPFSILVLFAELNLYRNVSWYGISKLLLGGTLISFFVTLFLSERANISADEAYWAGPIEETAKLMAAVFIARKCYLNGRILTGMLCGAAVGAGFSIFESTGYVFTYLLEAICNIIGIALAAETSGSQISPQELEALALAPDIVMIMRALLSPFGHIVWTAITAGALWRTMGQKRFSFGMFLQGSFLQIAIVPVLLHMFWNSTLMAKFNPYKWGICGLVAWGLALILVNEGIRQVRDEQNKH